MTDEFIQALQAKPGSVTTLSADVPERFLMPTGAAWPECVLWRWSALERRDDVSDSLAICSRFKVPVGASRRAHGTCRGRQPMSWERGAVAGPA